MLRRILLSFWHPCAVPFIAKFAGLKGKVSIHLRGLLRFATSSLKCGISIICFVWSRYGLSIISGRSCCILIVFSIRLLITIDVYGVGSFNCTWSSPTKKAIKCIITCTKGRNKTLKAFYKSSQTTAAAQSGYC